VLAAAALAVVATGCGESNQPSSVEWRNITMDLPDGWYLFEEEDTRLSLSNQDIGISEVEGEPKERPEGDTVAMFFTYEPGTVPDDWRDLLGGLDADIETDRALRLAGDVPATQIVYRYETQGVITREMAVVIPSRSVVLLAQPVPAPVDGDVSEVFLDHLDDFMSVLESAEFGAPVQ